MIRGRKEGSTYASWFIGFDHDNTFGLPPFPELPPQSPRTPVHNKPVSRASSLETLLPAGQSRDIQPVKRSVTPAGTQTSLELSTQTYTQTTEETGSQTPHEASSQTYTQTTEETGSQTTRTVSNRSFGNTLEETGSQTTRPISNRAYSQTFEEAESQTTRPVSNRTYNHTLEETGSQTTRPLSNRTYNHTLEETGSQTPNKIPTRIYNQITEETGSQTPNEIPTRIYNQTTEETGSQTPNGDPTRTYSQTTEGVRSQTPHKVSNQSYGQTTETALQRPHTISIRTYSQTTGGIEPRTPERVSTHITADSATDAFYETPDSRGLVYREGRLTPQDFNSHRSRRRREKDTQDIYKEAFDGAKRAEEFKFRVKFDKLIGDLHVSIEDNSHNGLTRVTSPSYGDMMLTYKDKVKDLLKGFTQRLQLAYENFGSEDSPENTGQKVRQNVSRFIEELIGETVDLTSDEAVSDLSSLSDDSASDQNSFEDFLAQAVVSKLLESHIKGVNESVQLLHNNNNNLKKNYLQEQGTDTQDNIIVNFDKDKLTSYDHSTSHQNIGGDNVDGYKNITNKNERVEQITLHNGDSRSNSHVFSYKSDFIPTATIEGSDKDSDNLHLLSGRKAADEDSIRSSKAGHKSNISHNVNRSFETNGINGDEIDNCDSNDETDIVKEFEQLKAFVKQTRARPKVKAIPFDDSSLWEVKEEPFLKTNVDRDEEREEFHTRYSVFDRIQNYRPALPDFSQFDNIDFESDDIDPDLLSMNLAIIPEETEEELEQEEDEDEHNRWKANWLFKGKGVSPYENMGKKTVGLDSEGSLYMLVPRPDDHHGPRIGHRDVDQLSEFSEHDLLGRGDLDGSDDEENTFYANTSEELARISGQHKRTGNLKRLSSGSYSDNSEIDGKPNRQKAEHLYDSIAIDHADSIDIPGPIVEPSRQDLKLLQDLVPAENDDPQFLIAPESVTVQEGDPVKFTCKVAGTAPVDVFWYREGDEVEELEESEDVEISSNGDKHSITIYNTSRQMAGQYMCIALNEKGKAIQYLVVTVKDNKQELKKPEFLKGLKDVEVTEGQSVKFRVKVKGYPQPRINWYKDGELLKNSKSCRIEKFGNRDYILTIDYASMNDDAEYTVSARNVAGEERMSAQVIVEPQSDFPVRKQRVSSNTTSGTSDSESDKSTPRRALPSNGGSSLVSSAHTLTPSKGTVQESDNQLRINHLDRKSALTRTKLNEEAQKMQGVAEREEASERNRLMTAETLSVLQVADEIIEHEKSTAGQSSNSQMNGEALTPSNHAITHTKSDQTSFQALNADSFIEDLGLPDTLDEFPLPNKGSKTTAPVASALEFTLNGENQSSQLRNKGTTPDMSNHRVNSLETFDKSRVLQSNISQHPSLHNQNVTDISSASYDSSKGLPSGDISASALSSVVTDSKDVDEADTALSISRQQMLREQYSRDFEVPQATGKKRWSVTLEPFSAQAEIVNRQNEPGRTNEKVNKLEISVTDFSSSSLSQSPKGDTSSQSSRLQSTDSGVSVNSKQKRPAPVHMVGHTTEDEVPESRTEFNTDGSIELPSVNRLKAMFSGTQDDDLGDGSFKRGQKNVSIHSITARNVPKDKLDKLKAYNQNESSPSSGKFLDIPGSSSSSPSSANSIPSPSASTAVSPSPSTSRVTLKPVKLSMDPSPSSRQNTSHLPSTGPYLGLDPDKDPVLIYPETDPEYMHRHHLHHHQQQQQHQIPGETRTLPKSTTPPQPKKRQQHIVSTASMASPLKPSQPQQTNLPVQRAVVEDDKAVKKSGPRIRTGCISARAAFWERRIVEGAAVDDDFPDMVEDGDT